MMGVDVEFRAEVKRRKVEFNLTEKEVTRDIALELKNIRIFKDRKKRTNEIRFNL